MQTIRLDEGLFRGFISLEQTEQGMKPWRIPHRELALFPPKGLSGHAATPAGVTLSFVSDTETVSLQVDALSQERSFDCVLDGKLAHTVVLPPDEQTVRFAGLPNERKRIDVYLPQTGPVTIGELAIDPQASWTRVTDDRPRWICYGSSITQCATAASPAQTWPAIAARGLGLQLTCLGYRGNCHLEPMVARMIRDREADFISLCIGINVYGSNSMNIRTFRAMVIGFLQIIRERHADIPIVIISPIISPPREETANIAGLTLEIIRREIEAALESLRQLGAEHLHYLHGLHFFGSEFTAYLPDELHPDAEGYRIMGSRFQQWIAEQGIREQIRRQPSNGERGNGDEPSR